MLDLVRHKVPKPIASHTDVETAIRAMWDVRSLALIRTFRIRFIATLILNLLVDGTGRCGETLPNVPEKVAKGQFLKWEDMEIWAFPDPSGATTPIIRITITFNGSNSALTIQTFSRPLSSTTPCVSRLLPPHNPTCIDRWYTSRLSVLGANRNLQAQPRRLHDQNQRRPFEATGIRQVSFDRT